MLTSKSNRPPLRVHFSFQANMATYPYPLLTTQDSARADARARASDAAPIDEHVGEAMLTSKSNRSPLRVHFSSQTNMATFTLRTIQGPPRAAARARTRIARCF
eukprot:5629854-Pyramimonas_sp.AAC.1